MIELYWHHIGYPISLIIGWLSDSISYPLSSIILPVSMIMLLHFIIWSNRGLPYTRSSPILKYWLFILPHGKTLNLILGILGLCLLLIQGFSQGITPYDFVPTKFRASPLSKLRMITQHDKPNVKENLMIQFQGYDSLSFENAFRDAENHWRSFWSETGPSFYLLLEPEIMLKDLNTIADRAIKALQYSPGRHVRMVKDMAGLPKLFGIAFGGPAYHDVITGEVVITSPEDYPISKIWRIKAMLHEIIHAKGFTDEMMTEQLTWLAFHLSSNPLHQALSCYMFLSKTPGRVRHPLWLLNSMVNQSIQRHHRLLNQPLVYWSKEIFSALDIQVSTRQYGYVRDKSVIFKKHPWFDFVYQAKLHFKGASL